MSLVKQIYRRVDEANGKFGSIIKEAAALLPHAGRFQVLQDVMDEVDRTQRTPFHNLLQILHHARLPYPATWIEWHSGGKGNLGYLIQQNPGQVGFRFRHFVSHPSFEAMSGFPVVSWLGWAEVDMHGWRLTHAADRASSAELVNGVNPYEQAAADVLCMLLLINSPSGLLKLGPAPESAKADAKRIRQGRPPLPNLRPISFNLAQIESTQESAPHPTDAVEVSEHHVRGHFKVRKTGLFWWSNHVRFKITDEAIALPKDYLVSNTEGNVNEG